MLRILAADSWAAGLQLNLGKSFIPFIFGGFRFG
jgi:hypothetical protein